MSSGFEDSCDGQPLAGLAKRFPAVKATLQTDSTQKKQAQRRQCVKLCDLALKFPEVACDVWAIAEPMLRKWQKNQEDKDDKFSEQYKQLWRLPASWKGAWIEGCTNGKVNEHSLAERMREDNGVGDICHWSFYYLTMTGPNDRLPPQCQSKKVCNRVFNKRHVDCGLQHRVDRLVDIVAGKQTFAEFGPYKIILDKQTSICTALKHDSGVTVDVPADDSFSLGWLLYEPHLDLGAYMLAPRTKRRCKLSSYFDDGKGPNINVDSLDKMAVTVYTALAEEVKALAKVLDTDSCSVIAQVHQDNKRQAAVIRARHMVESNKKRREDAGISLDKAKVEPPGEVLQEALGDEAEVSKQKEDDEAALNSGADEIQAGGTFFGFPAKSVTPSVAAKGSTEP